MSQKLPVSGEWAMSPDIAARFYRMIETAIKCKHAKEHTKVITSMLDKDVVEVGVRFTLSCPLCGKENAEIFQGTGTDGQ